MSQQTARQQARRQALDAQTRARIRRVEQDKRRITLARQVVQALSERDATIVVFEKRAGHALGKLTGEQGLTVRDAAQWCGGTLTTREASRLRQLAQVDAVEVAAVKSESVSVPAPSALR